MANPQPTDPHLRIAHSIAEAIMLRDFSKRHRKILDLILRLSWGCQQKSCIIDRLSDFGVVGVGKTHITSELNWLVQSKVITIVGNEYAFNKDFDQWQVNRVDPYSPEQLKKFISLNIKRSYQNGNFVTETVTDELPKRELLSYRNGNNDRHESESGKESSISIFKDSITRDTLDEYSLKVKTKFPLIDWTIELEKFDLYWNDGKRKLKNPKLALFNWMLRADKYRQNGGNGNGKNRQDSQFIPGNQPSGAFSELAARDAEVSDVPS